MNQFLAETRGSKSWGLDMIFNLVTSVKKLQPQAVNKRLTDDISDDEPENEQN